MNAIPLAFSKRCPVCGRTPVRENEYETIERIHDMNLSLERMHGILEDVKRSLVSAITLDEAKAILYRFTTIKGGDKKE